VFYNPAMAADRDIGVAFVRAWSDGGAPTRDGWDVLAATGVRGLRLLYEGRTFRGMQLTESHPEAYAVLRENARRYWGAVPQLRDARVPADARFDLVDLDPYGTPVPYLGTAISAVRPGGVLAVTATDMMVLAGVQRGAAERRYGGRSVPGRLGPEAGLRLLLARTWNAARALGRSVRPLIAYARDHYVRAYLEVREAGSSEAAAPIGTIDPSTWVGPPLGNGGAIGPLWLGPLLDRALVRRLDVPDTAAEPVAVGRFLDRLADELDADVPFYFESNTLAGRLGLASPPALDTLLTALRAEGFRAARTHARPEGFRTDAPRDRVEAIARRASAQSQNARVRA
jgi:tRNA (guanine26-N2/guanine27-N2)-dimethyltransferase